MALQGGLRARKRTTIVASRFLLDGRMMSNFQALVLGMMVAWTPSLVALSYLRLRAPLVESEEEWVSTSGIAEAKAGSKRDD